MYPIIAPADIILFWSSIHGVITKTVPPNNTSPSIWTLANDATWPLGGIKKLIVRSFYKVLADKVLDGTTKISLLLGIKGIGKTVYQTLWILLVQPLQIG